jgi:predicted  nucleic acid-binding Zn-ribbon protein
VREKEFRGALEQRAEDLRRSAQQDLSTLEAEIVEARALIGRQQLQIAALRDERDDAEQRAAGFKVECDGLELSVVTLRADHESTLEELHSVREALKRSEERYARLQREFEDYRCQEGGKESSALQSVTQQLVDAKTSHLEEITQLRRAHTEEIDRLTQEHEQALQQRGGELAQRQETDMLQVQRRLADRESELQICRDRLQELTAQLEEERKECAALKLRMSVYEAQQRPGGFTGKSGGVPPAPPRQEMRQASASLGRTGDDLHFPHQQDSPDASVRESGAFDYLHSPMFSEDLGTLPSYPTSPVMSMHRGPYGAHQPLRGSRDYGGAGLSVDADDYQHERGHPRGVAPHNRGYGEASSAWGESKTSYREPVFSDHRQHVPARGASREDRAVQEENEMLKKAVKEVCC